MSNTPSDADYFDVNNYTSNRSRLSGGSGNYVDFGAYQTDRSRISTNQGQYFSFDSYQTNRSRKSLGSPASVYEFTEYNSTRFRLYQDKDGRTFFQAAIPPPEVFNYQLAAVDSGSGRRYWYSQSPTFLDAPSPVGTWLTYTLTILSTWEP